MVDWLNYHHLLYFWMVAREGGITAAADALHLSQPTLSTQIQKLEKSLDVKLFQRKGRNLVLTETGQLVYQYADEIFSLGREMTEAIQGRVNTESVPLLVGIPDVLSKLMVYRLLQPVLSTAVSTTDDRSKPARGKSSEAGSAGGQGVAEAGTERVKLVCYEGKTNDLLSELALHRLDIVLSDSPVPSNLNIRAFNHLLGQCSISVFGTPELAEKYKVDFPRCLDGAPMLLPTPNTMLRRSLNQWFDSQDIHPRTIHEFEDSALLKVFGQQGEGLLVVPSAVEEEVSRQYLLRPVGRISDITEQFYAISVERRLKHPAVVRISQAAREHLFRDSKDGE